MAKVDSPSYFASLNFGARAQLRAHFTTALTKLLMTMGENSIRTYHGTYYAINQWRLHPLWRLRKELVRPS